MRITGLIVLVIMSFCVGTSLIAQPGQIIESGDVVLDPNLDGFISMTNAGFSQDGYDVDEFELKMFGIPIFGDGEALNDVQSGQPCGVVDLALDTAGYALYAGYDANENLIFRFRLAGDKKSVQSYSILIDTDQLVGAADPNSSAINPGFEIEITLIQKFGVFIYAIDGMDSCPTPIKAYSVDTHQQKATSSQQSCGDSDIYIDFYVPFADLTTLFGITPDTNVRFAGVTNISATCALDGSISDIGGVDDVAYDGCFSCAVLDLTENQCPSSVSNLCDTCGGFPLGATATPDIDLPVIVGDLNISGTAEPESEIYIALFSGIGSLLDRDTISTDVAGLWQSTDFSAPLNFGDSVVVNAMLAGKCESGLTDTGLSFAIVSPNQPPQITGSTISITYIENDPPRIIIDDATITDDNISIVSATVLISSNYQLNLDVLAASPPPGITSLFSAATGILTFSGTSSLANYDSAFRSVTFHNTSDAPSLDIRTISFIVNDGTNSSQPFNKNILITKVNDPPVIVVGTNPIDTIAVSTNEDVPLQICIDAQDVDLDILAISSATVVNGNGTILIEENLCSTFTPLENYNGLEFITVIICDNGSPALCDTVIVKVDVLPVNDPPVVLIDGAQTDSLSYRIAQGDNLDFCLDVTDIENDNLVVESIVLTSATSSTVTWQSGVCFNYNPEVSFIGIDRVEIIICDDGSPSRCTKVYIDIEVIDTNLPPVITTTTADTLFVEVFKNNMANICLDATDPDNDPLAFGIITDLLGVGGSTTLSYSCIDYLPPVNFVGRVLLDVNICDNISPPKCDGLVLSINVLPFNNPPEVVVESIPVDTVLVTTTENTPIDICLEVIDTDGDNVSTSSANTDTGNGSFNVDGSLCVQFSPDTDSTGEVWGTVTICDDGDPTKCTQTVIGVDVTPVNNPPNILFNGISVDTLYFETTRNTELAFCIDATDAESDNLTIGSIEEIQTGGFYIPGADILCLGFVPLDNFVGETLHLVTICDDGLPQGCDSVYVKVTVANVNSPPEILYGGVALDTVKVSTLQNFPIDVCVDTNDADGDAVFLTELSLIAGEGGATFTQASSEYCITYNPELNYFGKTWIKMIVCDSGQPSSCTEMIIEVDVININSAPEIFQNGIVNDTIRFTTPSRTKLTRCIDVLDKDGDNLSLDVSLPGSFIGSVTTDAANLCIDYTPDNEFLGSEYFNLTVCDDRTPTLCASVVVEINVYSNNSAPVINYQDQPVELVNDKAIEQTLFGLVFTVNDSLNDNLNISKSTITKGAGILDLKLENRNLLFDYTPEILSKGEHIIDITVCDDGLPILCDSISINLSVEQQKVFPYEAISPNGDGLNDFWVIDGIEHFPDNSVHIFDRWNNLVYTLEGYNNHDMIWKGESNRGLSKSDLDNGTYFYKLTLAPGGEVFSGMVVLKR